MDEEQTYSPPDKEEIQSFWFETLPVEDVSGPMEPLPKKLCSDDSLLTLVKVKNDAIGVGGQESTSKTHLFIAENFTSLEKDLVSQSPVFMSAAATRSVNFLSACRQHGDNVKDQVGSALCSTAKSAPGFRLFFSFWIFEETPLKM